MRRSVGAAPGDGQSASPNDPYAGCKGRGLTLVRGISVVGVVLWSRRQCTQEDVAAMTEQSLWPTNRAAGGLIASVAPGDSFVPKAAGRARRRCIDFQTVADIRSADLGAPKLSVGNSCHHITAPKSFALQAKRALAIPEHRDQLQIAPVRGP